jgi:hypothetical protein
MFKRQDKNSGILISIILISIVFVILALFSYLYTGSIFNPNVTDVFSVTGNGMYCSDKTQCEAGLVCQKTIIGEICLSPSGGPCNQLSDCVSGTSFCNGVCVSSKGNIGTVCSNSNQCESSLGCFVSPVEKNTISNLMRCYIP